MVAQFSPRQHNFLFEHPKSDTPSQYCKVQRNSMVRRRDPSSVMFQKFIHPNIRKIMSNLVSIPVSCSRIRSRVGMWMKLLYFNCWKTSFSLRVFSPWSPVLRRTLTLVPDEYDGACSGIRSTLISDWCEESQDELLVPTFLMAFAVFFALLNILQKNHLA